MSFEVNPSQVAYFGAYALDLTSIPIPGFANFKLVADKDVTEQQCIKAARNDVVNQGWKDLLTDEVNRIS